LQVSSGHKTRSPYEKKKSDRRLIQHKKSDRRLIQHKKSDRRYKHYKKRSQFSLRNEKVIAVWFKT
jgi:hypothetical protein